MKKNALNVAGVSALAGLTVAATVALPAIAAPAADQAAPDAGQPQVQPAQGALATSQVVKAPAVGTFSYDQTAVSSTAEILKMQGAGAVLCGAQGAGSAANAVAGTIKVSGAVDEEFCAALCDLVAEEPVNRLMTCSCGGNPAGGRAIVTADVKGVPVEYLLAQAGAQAGANTLTFVASDGSQVSVPLGYAIGRHAVIGSELNGEDVLGALGATNQLWMAKTPANYFLRDVVEIVVSCEDEVPVVAAAGQNSPNAGILAAAQ